MFTKGFISGLLIPSIIFGTCLPAQLWAVDSLPNTTPIMTDIALSDGGILEGQVVGYQNVGLPGVPVTVKQQNRDVATTTTATNGHFVVQDLRGGVYQVSTTQGGGIFRLWAPCTAPPAAKNRAIVYVQNGMGGGGLRGILGNPIVIPALIATAIAVPIAVSSQHQPASP